MEFATEKNVQPFTRGEGVTGLDKWRKAYRDTIPDAAALMGKINAFMNAFDADQDDKRKSKGQVVADDDGFQKVVARRNQKKRILPKVVAPVPAKLPKVLVNSTFYAKANAKAQKYEEIAHVRRQFEADKARIQEMRLKRSFKP